uniref:Uncharacterized protein n=2 Tax=Canis lupus familiaris TaxID=9615 RepID=A0A8C0S0P8_CANLF
MCAGNDAIWNTTVQWLAGDIACRTLRFLKLMATYAAAFLPVVIGLDHQEAVLHPLGPRSAGRKLLGTAWGLSFLLTLPQVKTRNRIPCRAPGAWSLLLPVPMSLPLSLCDYHK